ncbi:GNAT family N-acetyltransferase [Candidatus Mycobacterium wuenschmannii]|uniref:GNAT family N-acetyltransferase n=1 Tax=Candidatus Mycobacterium wuenschmannii TaxID=3027808 RepID=A0ABY8W253_9MYCO|nr:GNAT family N-acetyltransferase [Candidatus Mycobacterium wuenschmannii]WIM87864.1 GNAT family N-acetyltransferase [Candidatus Mycobacterium wuenschmannii]
MSVRIRRAEPGDAADITAMIHDLAIFERAPEQCTVVESQISSALFGPEPTLRAHVAEVDGQVAAMALWFLNFSTWDGVAGIYLEDLFVRPEFRRLGLARGLLTALARECVDNHYTRLAWAVLNWNSDAISLYDSVGGQPQSEWTTYRVSGSALSELAGPS